MNLVEHAAQKLINFKTYITLPQAFLAAHVKLFLDVVPLWRSL